MRFFIKIIVLIFGGMLFSSPAFAKSKVIFQVDHIKNDCSKMTLYYEKEGETKKRQENTKIRHLPDNTSSLLVFSLSEGTYTVGSLLVKCKGGIMGTYYEGFYARDSKNLLDTALVNLEPNDIQFTLSENETLYLGNLQLFKINTPQANNKKRQSYLIQARDRSDQLLESGMFKRSNFSKRIAQSTQFDVEATIARDMKARTEAPGGDTQALFEIFLDGQTVSKLEATPPTEEGQGKLALHFLKTHQNNASKHKLIFRRSGQESGSEAEAIKFDGVHNNAMGDFKVKSMPSGRYELGSIQFGNKFTPYEIYGEVDIREGETTYGGQVLFSTAGGKNDVFRVLIKDQFEDAKAQLGDKEPVTYQNMFTEKVFQAQLRDFRAKTMSPTFNNLEVYQAFKEAKDADPYE